MWKSLTLSVIFILLLSGFYAQPPANNDCADAQFVDVPLGETVCINSSTVGATTSGENGGQTCKATPINEVWFTFSAKGTQNTAVVRPAGTSPAEGLVVTIRNDPCGDLRQDDCEAAANPGDNVTATAGFTAGATIWVDVGTITTDGEFEICITSANPPPIPGNTCDQASRICDKSTITVDDLNGLSSSGFEPGCFKNSAGNPEAVRQDIWYKFTVGKPGDMQWLAKAPPGTGTEFDWAIYDITDGCPDPTDPADIAAKEIACNYNYGGGNSDPIGMHDTSTTVCPITAVSGQYPKEVCPPHNFQPSDVGRTFAIMMSNYSQNGEGFTLTWDGEFEIAPTAKFDISPTEACGELVATVSDSSIASVDWQYTFDGGNPPDFNYQDNVNVPPIPPKEFDVTFSDPGTHLVTLVTTSATGCTDVQTVPVEVSTLSLVTDKVDANCNAKDGMACVTATGKRPFTYTWAPVTGSDSCIENIGKGTYSVIVKDGTGLCSKNATVIVESPGSVVADFTPNPSETDIENPTITLIDESQDATSWEWVFGDGSDPEQIDDGDDGSTVHNFDSIGTYTIMLIAQNETGCVDTAYGTVVIKGLTTFYVPNAFTPDNEDSHNDNFGGSGIGIEEYEMWIYDRWGLLIFETNDLAKRWNGLIEGDGSPAPEDVYVWVAKIKDTDGEEHKFVGHVTLVR